MWEHLESRQQSSRHGYRCNLNRFQGAVTCPMEAIPLWHTLLFERLYLALEQDWMTGKSFNEQIVLRSGPAEQVTEDGGTIGKRVTIEDRSLKSCATNAVVISCLLLGSPDNKRILASIVQASQHVKEWHGHQNRTLRSTEASQRWLCEAASGQYMVHVESVIGDFESFGALQAVGAKLHTPKAEREYNAEMLVEDEHCEIWTNFSLALVAARCARGLWLTVGWPGRMVAVLDANNREEVLRDMRLDLEIWDELQGISGKTALEQALQGRHLFNLTCNRQYLVGLQETGWQATERFLDVVERRSRSIIATQAVEDIHGTQKNTRQIHGSKRSRRPETSFAVVLRHRVLEDRHDFTPVSADAPVHSKMLRLTPDVPFGLCGRSVHEMNTT